MINATKEKIQGKYGSFDALVISGPTLPIMNQLKSKGFKWYGPKKSWWISYKNVNQYLIDDLKNLGVLFAGDKNPVTTPANTLTTTPQESSKKQWVTENEEMSKWYGFPINKNILSYNEKVNVGGKDYDVNISIDRSYVLGGDIYQKRKSREFKGKPKYLLNISVPEINYSHSWKKVSKQLWGTYDEETFLNDIIKPLIKTELLDNEIIRLIQYKNEIAARTPEYKKFLNDIGENKLHPSFDFHINAPPYEGDYKVQIDSLGADENTRSLYIITSMDKEGAPSPATVSYKAQIDNTYTIDDFNKKIQEHLIENHDKIQENYVKYLQSFPFLPSQQKESMQSLEKFKSMLNSPQSYVNEIFDEIKKRGYIRPHKRQKQYSGLTSGEEIKWIIDSKKIVSDAYSRESYLAHTPDYFYAVVAYYIHRQERNIYSWTDMMLVASMEIWQRNMKRYGVNISMKEIEAIVSSVGQAILKLFQKDIEQESTKQENITGVLKDFADLAQKYGISIEGIENNVRNIYRSLVKFLHPDKYTDPQEKQQKTTEFQQLQNLYEAIPEQYKIAGSWYDLYVESEVQKIIIKYAIKENLK